MITIWMLRNLKILTKIKQKIKIKDKTKHKMKMKAKMLKQMKNLQKKNKMKVKIDYMPICMITIVYIILLIHYKFLI